MTVLGSADIGFCELVGVCLTMWFLVGKAQTAQQSAELDHNRLKDKLLTLTLVHNSSFALTTVPQRQRRSAWPLLSWALLLLGGRIDEIIGGAFEVMTYGGGYAMEPTRTLIW